MLTRPDSLRRAALLAFGVVAFEHVRHLGATQPGHAVMDAALALPLGLITVSIGARVRPGAGRVVLTALLFSALLVPAAAVHGLMHAAVTPASAHVHVSAVASGWDHHARDAATALPVSLLLAAIGFRVRSPSPRRRWALGAAVAVLGASLPVAPAFADPPPAFSVAMPNPPPLNEDNITLDAAETQVQIMPTGPATKMWTFNGTFPGPTIRRPSGATTTVTVLNSLPASMPAPTELTLHHHGNHSAASEDGHPHDPALLISRGGRRTYTYEFKEDGSPERPAFQWYHDHRMDATARNVWMGLAGMVIIDPHPDDPEASLNLPSGAFDVPIMIADRTFDALNQIDYTFNANGVPANTILANGAPQPYFTVEARKYRLRLLNASNTRAYLLRLGNSDPMTQIGTESGLLPKPIQRSRIRLEPAERAEIVLDFSSEADGARIALLNDLGFGPALSQIMQFRVTGPPVETPPIPNSLRQPPDYGDALTLPAVRDDGDGPAVDYLTRVWLLTQAPPIEEQPFWTINSLGYDPTRVDARPVLGTVEKWVFVNTTSVTHVMHIHDVDWRVLLRAGGLEADPDAGGETGLKESFLVRPFEVVEVAARFTDHLGVYVFHCHILEHEDHSMMAQFEVVEPGLENQLPL